MDDIAKELGMSKKTIYQFYKEKDDLINQLCEMELKEHECAFTDFSKIAKDPIHEIMLISDKMRSMMQHINPMFFMDLQKFYPNAFNRFQLFKEDYAYQNILSNIKTGIEQGLYRSDLDPEFVARLRLAQIDMLMFGNYFTYEKTGLAKINDLTFEIFVYGICTIKGHKLFNNYKKINEEE